MLSKTINISIPQYGNSSDINKNLLQGSQTLEGMDKINQFLLNILEIFF